MLRMDPRTLYGGDAGGGKRHPVGSAPTINNGADSQASPRLRRQRTRTSQPQQTPQRTPPRQRTNSEMPYEIDRGYWFRWTKPGTKGYGEFYGGKVVHIVQNRVTGIWYDTEQRMTRILEAFSPPVWDRS